MEEGSIELSVTAHRDTRVCASFEDENDNDDNDDDDDVDDENKGRCRDKHKALSHRENTIAIKQRARFRVSWRLRIKRATLIAEEKVNQEVLELVRLKGSKNLKSFRNF